MLHTHNDPAPHLFEKRGCARRLEPADIEREYRQRKSCEPWCTISCVHQTAMLDQVREHPREMLEQLIARRHDRDPSFRTPLLLRALEWAFLSDPGRRDWWGRVPM